jgi:hypothetical protein
MQLSESPPVSGSCGVRTLRSHLAGKRSGALKKIPKERKKK